MKLLTAIAIVQLAAIVVLFGKIASLEAGMSSPLATEIASAAETEPASLRTARRSVRPSTFPDEQRLRLIIREELAARVAMQPVPPQHESGDGDRADVDPAELQARRDRVAEQLELYASVGAVTDIQMQKLQADIAKLDPRSRTQMLGELARAINSGRLDGRL